MMFLYVAGVNLKAKGVSFDTNDLIDPLSCTTKNGPEPRFLKGFCTVFHRFVPHMASVGSCLQKAR